MNDRVHESDGNDTGGIDTVYARGTYTLGAGEHIETLRAAPGTNGLTLTGNAFANTLVGTKGGDTLDGGGGADKLYGAAGANSLTGGEGNDRLQGGADHDTLTGGADFDKLIGGGGTDTFVFEAADESTVGASRDVIYDFSGDDTIDLSAIDADSVAAGVQHFHWIGTDKFHVGDAGQLHDKASGTNGAIVEGDVNGDGKADFQIAVRGVSTLQASNFDGLLAP